MHLDQVKSALHNLSLGGIRYFDEIGSTNDEAKCWAEEGAANFALVLANSQTAGRGRGNRAWLSPAGSSLAFSLVLYPAIFTNNIYSRLTALGALAVKEALLKLYRIHAQIKWPNDILVDQKKLGGILAEALWNGDEIRSLIIGIGINVALESCVMVNQHLPAHALPATSIESAVGKPVDRLELLRSILNEIVYWYPRITTREFLAAWETCLAFRGEWVQVISEEISGKINLSENAESASSIVAEGLVIGLSPDGALNLRTSSGAVAKISAGEVHLRPSNAAAKEHQIS